MLSCSKCIERIYNQSEQYIVFHVFHFSLLIFNFDDCIHIKPQSKQYFTMSYWCLLLHSLYYKNNYLIRQISKIIKKKDF